MKSSLLFICLLPFLAISQSYRPGYVLLNNGDTVHGFVKHPFGSPYGFVFRDSAQVKKDFPKETVNGFYIENEGLFRNIVFQGDGKQHMVNVRVQGYLSYYEVQLGSSSDSYFHILEKKGAETQCWYSADLFAGFKDKMTQYLSDDSTLCEKIRQGIYTRKNILEIVTSYNDFHDRYAAADPLFNLFSLSSKRHHPEFQAW